MSSEWASNSTPKVASGNARNDSPSCSRATRTVDTWSEVVAVSPDVVLVPVVVVAAIFVSISLAVVVVVVVAVAVVVVGTVVGTVVVAARALAPARSTRPTVDQPVSDPTTSVESAVLV